MEKLERAKPLAAARWKQQFSRAENRTFPVCTKTPPPPTARLHPTDRLNNQRVISVGERDLARPRSPSRYVALARHFRLVRGSPR